MKLSLQYKIFGGYLVLVAIIGFMVAILLHEQCRIKEIAASSVEISNIRLNVTAVHREVTELVTLGESVLGWDDEDCRAYRAKRICIDSLLFTLRQECVRFVRPEQVDTLRLPTVVASAAKPRIEVHYTKGIARFLSCRKYRLPQGYARRIEANRSDRRQKNVLFSLFSSF